WSLTRTADKADPAALEPYERTIYDGLFGRAAPDDRTTKRVALIQQFNARVGAAPAYLEALKPKPTDVVKLSDLKEHFYTTLSKAQRELYTDSVAQCAHAFKDIDATRQTAGWYSGSALGALCASDLSNNLRSFSDPVSSTVASTPGGSGGSGFGGGSGGGGGGGGGGS